MLRNITPFAFSTNIAEPIKLLTSAFPLFAIITVQNISKSDFVKQDTSKSTQKAQYYAGVLAGSISGTRKTIIKDCVI